MAIASLVRGRDPSFELVLFYGGEDDWCGMESSGVTTQIGGDRVLRISCQRIPAGANFILRRQPSKKPHDCLVHIPIIIVSIQTLSSKVRE